MSTAGVPRRNFVQGVGAVALATADHAAAAKLDQPLYEQAFAGVAVRVKDLLSRMTLREKVAQTMCIWIGKNRVQNERGDFDAARAAQALPHRLGMLGRPSDRDSLELIGQQNDLAAAIFALNKPTVVFLLNGKPLSINLLQAKASAIIEGWYLGQETGHAAADILCGRANPGGKLPISIPRNVGQLPVYYNAKPTANRGYLGSDNTPLYPFGFGLSYTKFALSERRLSKTTIAPADNVTVSVDVTNTGKRAGDEVVQLYIRDDISSVTRPVKELKGFARVTLVPGEKRTVTLTITPAELQFYGMDMKRVVEPGSFTIMARPNSVDLKATTLTVAAA
ncbi:glycoside hydrolase family 3 C-terminal domain-containing protein [Roseateles sp.]|uniref:glycoside hydrolase family 3 C-terminal domain-containing protein n=1 Tax=Roseateles sp. TaxID=1971397 RepID=UPI003265AC1A